MNGDDNEKKWMCLKFIRGYASQLKKEKKNEEVVACGGETQSKQQNDDDMTNW